MRDMQVDSTITLQPRHKKAIYTTLSGISGHQQKQKFEAYHNDYNTHNYGRTNCMDYMLLALSGNGNKFSCPITKFGWIVL